MCVLCSMNVCVNDACSIKHSECSVRVENFYKSTSLLNRNCVVFSF